jgi:hypothetical protein
MICLNSVSDWIRWSSAITWHVWASAPVLISFDVAAMTGYARLGSMKLSRAG